MKHLLFSLLILSTATALQADDDDAKGSIKVPRKASWLEMARLARLDASEAITKALAAAPGHVVELDLERDDGRLVYEVKIAQEDGTMVELELDAGTGAVLEREQDD